jgi:molybdopterin-guanine dinucleotide biosynthesis protein A
MLTTGIILAGGKSSRMGSDKGLIPLNGKPMIEHVIDNLKKLNIPIIIISNNSEYSQFGLPVYEDEFKDKGPVAGIYTGLLHSKTDTNIVLSCDVPFASTELLKHLLENSQDSAVTLPKLNGKIHPLIGIYKTNTLPTFKEHLKNDQRKLIKVCNRLNSRILDLSSNSEFNDETLFKNMNTEEDLKS